MGWKAGRSQLDPEFCLVAVANGQIVLTAPGEEFFARVDWSGDQPAGWRPHEDPASPVRVNPLVRFGQPAVGGISTEAIAGELDGGPELRDAMITQNRPQPAATTMHPATAPVRYDPT